MEEKIKLILFPGHYPRNPGACYYGLIEHFESCKVIDALIPILSKKYEIFTFIGNPIEKAVFARQANADYIFDIHFNADPDNDSNDLIGRGTEVLINPYIEKNNKLYDLAESISNSISTILEIPNRGIKPGWNRNNPQQLYYILKQFPEKALLIETLFIDNKKESEFLLNKEYLKIASAIASGIQRSLFIPNQPDIRSPS